MAGRKLKTEECRKQLDESLLNFETTMDVTPSTGVVAQDRALEALEFGLEIRQPRFHVVVVGNSLCEVATTCRCIVCLKSKRAGRNPLVFAIA